MGQCDKKKKRSEKIGKDQKKSMELEDNVYLLLAISITNCSVTLYRWRQKQKKKLLAKKKKKMQLLSNQKSLRTKFCTL